MCIVFIIENIKPQRINICPNDLLVEIYTPLYSPKNIENFYKKYIGWLKIHLLFVTWVTFFLEGLIGIYKTSVCIGNKNNNIFIGILFELTCLKVLR